MFLILKLWVLPSDKTGFNVLVIIQPKPTNLGPTLMSMDQSKRIPPDNMINSNLNVLEKQLTVLIDNDFTVQCKFRIRAHFELSVWQDVHLALVLCRQTIHWDKMSYWHLLIPHSSDSHCIGVHKWYSWMHTHLPSHININMNQK